MGKMSREDLFREIGEIDETYVEEAQRVRRSRRVSPWVGRTLVTAASLVLCVGVGYVALQLTQGGMDNTGDASSSGGAMEAAQEMYSMMEADDRITEGAAPEEAMPEMAAAGPDSQEEAQAQQDRHADTDAESDRGQISNLIQELKEDGAEKESALEDKLFQGTGSIAMNAMDLIWEAARTDAAYGRYVDVQVPEGYSYVSGTRSESALHVIWHKGMEEISISCHHADESVSDWLVDTDNPEEYDLGLYTIPWCESVPEELIQKVDSATFRPDQISQEIVAARSYQVEEQGDASGWRTQIAILYSDNVLVEIRSKGPSPEEIYRLIYLEN